jgi:hypothetical protein
VRVAVNQSGFTLNQIALFADEYHIKIAASTGSHERRRNNSPFPMEQSAAPSAGVAGRLGGAFRKPRRKPPREHCPASRRARYFRPEKTRKTRKTRKS